MADNVNVNSTGSTPIATDDIAGVQFQKVKLNLGTDGVDDGLVSDSNPLPTEDKTIADLYYLFAFFMDRLEFGINTTNAKMLKVDLSGSGALSNISTLASVTNVTTLQTVSDQTNIGGLPAKRTVEAQLDAAYNTGFLQNITF